MATPHYVAQKVGDQYVLVRQDALGQSHRSHLLMAGGVLAAMGLMRHGIVRWGFLAVAAGLVGMAGGCGCVCQSRQDASAESKRSHFNRGPSYPREQSFLHPRQNPHDQVEEASMESFPASDSPS